MNLKKHFMVAVAAMFLFSCSVPEKKDTSSEPDFTEFDDSAGTDVGKNDDGDLDKEFDALNDEEETSTDQVAENSSEKDEFSDFEESASDDTESKSEKPSEQMTEQPVEEPPVAKNQAEVVPEPTENPSDQGASNEPTGEPPVADNSLDLEPEPPMPSMDDEPAKVTVRPKKNQKGLPDPVISGIQYRANEAGGTLIVEGNSTLNFSTKLNPDTRQFVVIVKDVELPARLQRPFDTRDFTGPIGSVDAYQRRGSGEARIVVQLRPGAPEPVVQAEGNTLFIVAQNGSAVTANENESSDGSMGASGGAVEDSTDLFAKDRRFTGKKISIETDGAEVRDVLKLLSEEANVNLVIGDDVSGKISLKLKAVPWDQALVMIMKSKKLGYTRSGNVLRIASIKEIREEEDAEMKELIAKSETAPLTMKTLSINYAKVDDLAKQAEAAKSPKGKVVADSRTSTLILNDSPEHVSRMEALVRSLDIPPQQVLIEGKVVEAKESFTQDIGVRWGLNASSAAGNQATSMRSGGADGGFFGLGFQLGTVDGLANLDAALALNESLEKVKVISSPRVMTLHNEAAEISQSTQVAVPQVTTIGSSTAPTTTYTYKEILLKLNVTPQVTNDGSIILSVDVMRQVPGARTGDTFPVDSRSAKTKVIVRNNQTAVVGGIYQNDNTDGTTGIPGLSKLPVLGWLFKSNKLNQQRNELLIFITPRLVNQVQASTGESNEEEL